MKKRLTALLTVLVFLFSMMQFNIFAESASVVLDDISGTVPGGTVTISGTTTLREIVINVKDPYNIDLYYNVIRLADGSKFSDTITIPSDAATGTYTVLVGSGESYATRQFQVRKTGSGEGSSSTPAPTPGNIIQAPPPVLGSDNNASVTINKQVISTALEAHDAVTVVVPGVSGASSYTVKLPAEIFIPADPARAITIETAIGTITVPGNMFPVSEIKDTETIFLKIAITEASGLPEDVRQLVGGRPVIELWVFADGKPIAWENPEALVTVSVPYIPSADELKDPEHIVVRYIDSNGQVKAVPSGRYNPASGTVTFTTTHFSKFAVAFVYKSFDDIAAYPWAKKAIEVLASKGIIAGTGPAAYSPAANITRADFLVLLTKTLGLTAKVDSNFKDVHANAYYYEAVGICKKLGITYGVGNDMFAPDEKITRQDMFALIHRAMVIAGRKLDKGTISDISSFKDFDQSSTYAVESVATLVRNGLVVGHDNKLNPRANTTRAEAAVVLYRLYYK